MGSSVDVTISGADLDEATELHFSDPRIKGKVKQSSATAISPAYPVANQFSISIPADVEPGIYEVRAYGRFGLSTPRRFVVSANDESAGNDQNRTSDSAMALPMNHSVSAKAIANSKHFFKFSLKKDEKVSLVCQTRKLDSKMNPVMVITDLTGREIARGRSSTLESAKIFFKAPIASQYILHIRDAVFAGGADYFYRLTLSNQPYVAAVDPVILQKGSNSPLTLLGWNLPGGVEKDGIEFLQKPANEVVGPARFSAEMPLQTSGASLEWQTVSLKQGKKAVSNLIPIYVVNRPVTLEDSNKAVSQVSIPADIAGRFTPNNEEDEYEFNGKAGEVYHIDVYSHRLGKPTDVILSIHQQVKSGEGTVTWKRLSVVDDPGNRAGGIGPNFTTTTDDPGLRFQIPADGVYRVRIKDQFGTYDFDPASTYAISIRRPAPDFRVVCRPVYSRPANGNQILAGALALRRGGRSIVNFSIERFDGFTGPVEVTCQGMPAGIECPSITLAPHQNSGDLVFYAKDDAKVCNSLIQITGKSKLGDTEIIREAFYACVTWDTANKGQTPAFFRRTSKLELSVLPDEVAAVTIDAAKGTTLETSLGGKLKVPVKLIRRNGFVDPLKLVAQNLPGQLKPGDLTIAKDKNDGSIEIFVKDKNTAVGSYTFCLKGDAKFKYSRNPQAAAREEAEFNRLGVLLKNTKDEKVQIAADSANATKSMPMLDKQVADAQQKLNAAKTAADMSLKKIQALEAAINKTKDTKPPVDPLVIQAAEANLATLKAAGKNTSMIKAAEMAFDQAQKNKADAQAIVKMTQQKLAGADAKIKQIEAAQKAAKSRMDSQKKQSAPKDLFYVGVSNPVQIKIVASPLVVAPIPEQANTVESRVTPTFKVDRKYGFADAVNLSFKVPAGIVVKPAVLAKDKSELPVEFEIQKNCAAGTHKIEVSATAKFNNVDVKTITSFNLKVSGK